MIDGRFQLPADVRLDPVESFPPTVLDGFEFVPGELAVTRPRSRTPTHIVTESTGRLLQLFREPTAIADAVIQFSHDSDADPAAVLEGAFPALRTLVGVGLLVPANSQYVPPIEFQMARGDSVGSLVIDQPVALIIDTEVYRARGDDGRWWAVKIARPGAEDRLRTSLHREAAILTRLDGACSPCFLREGTHDGRPFIAMEWCRGVDVASAAELIRRETRHGRREMKALVLAILDAYTRLHDSQVLHGDVHPRNLLVDGGGAVRIIDFGQAHVREGGMDRQPGRGVVDLYLEPELASARLAGEQSPPPTPAGEQYSVAALLYYVICGAHTHDFVLERRKMLSQVAGEPPLSLEARGITGLEHVQAVLGQALAKSAENRFASLRDFRRALEQAFTRDDGDRSARSTTSKSGQPGALLLQDFTRRCRLGGALLADGIDPPLASVNFGAAGIAIAMLRIAQSRSDASLLAAADVWCERAMTAERSVPDDAFTASTLEMSSDVVGDVSLFHSRPGLALAAAFVADAQAELVRRRDAVDRFVTLASASESRSELVFGVAGALLGCGLLLDLVGDAPAGQEASSLRRLGEELSRTLLARVEKSPPIGGAGDSSTLGVAHGHAGVLYPLLQWALIAKSPVDAQLHSRLEQLADLAQPTGRGIGWPVHTRGTNGLDAMRGTWCNGAAGHLHLWLLASEITNDPRYLELAVRSAWTCFETPRTSADLCCGSAGRAYALLRLYRCTADAIWLARARDLADHAATTIRTHHLRQNSLYRGEAGVCVLAADLEDPANARMPVFEPG